MGHHAKTVSIVDDSAAIRNELREEFSLHGYVVCAEAEDGRKAIEQARVNRPELIILHRAMPIMNVESAPELRKVLPDAPIINQSSR
jgi:two-component system, response regulator YesN